MHLYTQYLCPVFSLMLMADMAVMAYLYKAFYGRLITNEVLSNDQDESGWKFNEKDHKYARKSAADYKIEKEMENVKSDYYCKKINEIREELVEEEKEEDTTETNETNNNDTIQV